MATEMRNDDSGMTAASVRQFKKIIDNRIAKSVPKPVRSRKAVVKRVDMDGTVWADIVGGDGSTPIEVVTATTVPGDVIDVRIEGGKAYGSATSSNPTVTTSYLGEILKLVAAATNGDAVAFNESALQIDGSLADTIQSMGMAAEAAQDAQSSADSARYSADAAMQSANDASESSRRAFAYLLDVEEDWEAIDEYRVNAEHTLVQIDQTAAEADASAKRANTYANNALTQLSFVEDVAGTIDWIQRHGTFVLTSDTSVQEGTAYFSYNASTHDYEPVVIPTGNPQSQGWYVLDVADSQTDFLMAHLAVTTRGLWVLPNGTSEYSATSDTTVQSGVTYYERIGDAASGYTYAVVHDPVGNPSESGLYVRATQNATGYKALLSSDGMYIYDSNGVQVALYGNSGIVYAPGKGWHIGNEDAYIVYTPASNGSSASITIGGSNIRLGDSRTLSELLGEIDRTIVFKITEEYSQDESSVTLTAHVYRGGEDIASSFEDTDFAWFRKNEDGSPLVPLPSPYTNGRVVQVQRSSVGYGAAIVCRFTEPNDSVLLDSDDDTLTDSEGTPIAARTPSGDYVRVADLEATTIVFDTDKLMLVGAEEEQLVTIATLKDVFGDGDYERLDNMPSIEDVTLVGNRTFPDLGIFKTDSQGYPVADDYTLTTLDINSLWANAQPIGA